MMKLFKFPTLSLIAGVVALAAATLSAEEIASDLNDSSSVRDLGRNGRGGGRWGGNGGRWNGGNTGIDGESDGGRWGGRHHGGGGGGHKGNYTAFLEAKCAAASIVCDDVKDEELSDCSNYTSLYGFHHDDGTSEDGATAGDTAEDGDLNRALHVQDDATIEQIEIHILGDFLDGVDLMMETKDNDIEQLESFDYKDEFQLRGSSVGVRNLHRHRPHNYGDGDGGSFSGGGSGGKWGNLTSAEIEAIKAKRLLCKCCASNN